MLPRVASKCGKSRAAEIESAVQIDVHHLMPLGRGELRHGKPAYDAAGVVDQHIQASETGDRLTDSAVALRVVAYVTGHEVPLGACGMYQIEGFLRRLRIARGNCYRRASAGKAQGGGTTNANIAA